MPHYFRFGITLQQFVYQRVQSLFLAGSTRVHRLSVLIQTILIAHSQTSCIMVDQPPIFYKSQKKRKVSEKKKQETTQGSHPVSEETALNYHSSHAALMVTLNYYHNKS